MFGVILLVLLNGVDLYRITTFTFNYSAARRQFVKTLKFTRTSTVAALVRCTLCCVVCN